MGHLGSQEGKVLELCWMSLAQIIQVLIAYPRILGPNCRRCLQNAYKYHPSLAAVVQSLRAARKNEVGSFLFFKLVLTASSASNSCIILSHESFLCCHN